MKSYKNHPMMKYFKHEPWNRCDVCGKFIAYKDFDKGATRRMITPDSDYSCESYETMCIMCNRKEEFEKIQLLQNATMSQKVIRFKKDSHLTK